MKPLSLKWTGNADVDASQGRRFSVARYLHVTRSLNSYLIQTPKWSMPLRFTSNDTPETALHQSGSPVHHIYEGFRPVRES